MVVRMASVGKIKSQGMNEDLKQYITNLLYYAHIEAQTMTMKEFDEWVEREVDNIDSYFKETNKNEQHENTH